MIPEKLHDRLEKVDISCSKLEEVIQTRVCGPQVCCHFLFSPMQLQIGQMQMPRLGGQQLLPVTITASLTMS